MKSITSALLALSAIFACTTLVGSVEPLLVEVKQTPSQDYWRSRPTRTLSALPGFIPTPSESGRTRWGGWASQKVVEGTGFFRTYQAPNGRWWLLDPDGHKFIHIGVATVTRGLQPLAFENSEKIFPIQGEWAKFSSKLLSDAFFNGSGAWSEVDAIRNRPDTLPYTLTLNFAADFGRQLKITEMTPGRVGYNKDVPPVLHPDFPDWCDRYAKEKVAPYQGDPMLLGMFSDNELPLRRELLERSINLGTKESATAPLYHAAVAWLRAHRGDPLDEIDIGSIQEEERVAFLEYACERYYSSVAKALRKYAPSHLILGSRIHGRITYQPEVLRASARHVDVVSVNLYHAWSVDTKRLDMWMRETGKPVIISEFYAKGQDTGMDNNAGAGWTVKTQRDRGLFYQNFVLSLIESRHVVGWHWFKYRDNEPWAAESDPSNRNVNKGVVTWDYKPYVDLLAQMSEVNAQVYPLTEYFDRLAPNTRVQPVSP